MSCVIIELNGLLPISTTRNINFCLAYPLQKLAKSEEEDIAGTYFKPQRANRLMEQVKETKRNGGKMDCNIKAKVETLFNNLS